MEEALWMVKKKNWKELHNLYLPGQSKSARFGYAHEQRVWKGGQDNHLLAH